MADENQTPDRGDSFTPTEGEESFSVTPKEEDKESKTPASTAPEGDEKAPEGEKEGEEKEGEEEEKEGEKKERAKYIPRARFDKALEKAKSREAALQEQINALQQGQMTQQQSSDLNALRSEIDDLQDKYEDLLLDGKKADAKAVRAQIRQKEEALVDLKANTTSQAMREQTIDQLKYEQALASAESTYPELNPDHENFNEEVTNEVAELMESFIARGYRRQAALERSIRYVLGARNTENREETRQNRERAARQKSAEANARQPASMAKVGQDSDKAGMSDKGPDIMRMSQDAFAKLDEETKARMRGDDV